MTVDFHRIFRKRYKKIPLKIRRRFDERLLLFMREPFHPILNSHPLSGDRRGQWSINITGDWRAICVFKNTTTVVFIDTDTHGNLYR